MHRGRLLRVRGLLVKVRGFIVRHRGLLARVMGRRVRHRGRLVRVTGCLVRDRGRLVRVRGFIVKDRGLAAKAPYRWMTAPELIPYACKTTALYHKHNLTFGMPRFNHLVGFCSFLERKFMFHMHLHLPLSYPLRYLVKVFNVRFNKVIMKY